MEYSWKVLKKDALIKNKLMYTAEKINKNIMNLQLFFNMSLVTRKPVFGIWDQVRLKSTCSATEAS